MKDAIDLKIEINKLYSEKLSEDELNESARNLLGFYNLLLEIDQQKKEGSHENQ